jgi:hypothetical protein
MLASLQKWEGGKGGGKGEKGRRGAEANLSIRGGSAFTHKKVVSEKKRKLASFF